MSFRKLLNLGLAIVVGLVAFAPATASAQGGNHAVTVLAWSRVSGVSALPDQLVRVTVVNPKPMDSTTSTTGTFTLTFNGAETPTTLAPGAAHTFTIDPITTGELIDPNTGARRVIVSVGVNAQVRRGQTVPDPAITIEIVDARTGATTVAFDAVPTFMGGVRSPAKDLD